MRVMQHDPVIAQALRAILMEATAVKYQSPKAAKFGFSIAHQAMVAITASETFKVAAPLDISGMVRHVDNNSTSG